MSSSQRNRPSSKTGSAGRAPVNIYYRSRRRESDSPFQRKTPKGPGRRKILLGFLDIILVLLLLIGLVYSLIVTPHPKLVINNSAFHRVAEYQTAADKIFSTIKNRNKITFDQQAITDALKKKFPEIVSADIELPIFSQEPTLRLDISKASLRLESGATNYIVDSQGVIVFKGQGFPAADRLPKVIDKSGFTTKLGSHVLSASSINFIKALYAQCQHSKVPLASLTIPTVAQELDLRAKDQRYYVKFFLGGDPLTQSGQYLAARKHFSDIHKQPASYLDVRVNGKIFFK